MGSYSDSSIKHCQPSERYRQSGSPETNLFSFSEDEIDHSLGMIPEQITPQYEMIGVC